MTTTVWTERASLSSVADAALRKAAAFWFLVAVAGQWMFAFYVAMFYGGAAARGNLMGWNKTMPHGYVPGDTVHNTAVAVHLLLAVLITGLGPLQLVPQLRSLAPRFHRWIGRLYIPAVVLISSIGLYMVWSRSRAGHIVQYTGITLDAALIIVFAGIALRHALKRDFRTHRRWALRLFIAVNGVWFFRVGLMLWIALNGGPAGFNPKTFTGPFLDVWAFANILLPLFVLELYLRTDDRTSVGRRFALAATIFVLTLGMGGGILMATFGMWLPRL